METGLPTPNKMKTNDRRFDFHMISNESKQDLFEGVDSKWGKRISTVCVNTEKVRETCPNEIGVIFFVRDYRTSWLQQCSDHCDLFALHLSTEWFEGILCLKPVALVPIAAQSHACQWLMECESMSISESKKTAVRLVVTTVDRTHRHFGIFANVKLVPEMCGAQFLARNQTHSIFQTIVCIRLWLLCYYGLYWFLLEFGIGSYCIWFAVATHCVHVNIRLAKECYNAPTFCQSIFINFICSFFSFEFCSLCDLRFVCASIGSQQKNENVSRKQKHREYPWKGQHTHREREKIRSSRCLCVVYKTNGNNMKDLHLSEIIYPHNGIASAGKYFMPLFFLVDAFLFGPKVPLTHTQSRMLDALSFCYLRFNKYILIFWLFRKRRTVCTQFSWMFSSSVFCCFFFVVVRCTHAAV